MDPGLTRDLKRVISLCLDQQDGLWLGTESQGVVWLDRRDLDEQADGRPSRVDATVFGRDEGLGSLACSGFSAGMVHGADGRVWIATADGLSVVNPKELRRRIRESIVPTVLIEEVLVDDRAVALGGRAISPPSPHVSNPSVTLPAGSSRMEVRFSAIDLASAGHGRFQYRLKNYSDGWEDAGTMRSALFHKLPPGEYSFEVRAANVCGVWNEEPALLAVALAPYWWQHRLVQAGFAALALAGAWAAYAARLRAMRRRHALHEAFSRELINSQERERNRIDISIPVPPERQFRFVP